jgi:hypothetical protein
MAGTGFRQTVDLSTYPDLVVIYLGMQVTSARGLKTLMTLGPQIQRAVAARPEGLLRHEDLLFSLLPLHVGMRQYWRDFTALETWARSLPHQRWWTDFLRDQQGTGFWHETYFMRGGMEAIYDAMPHPLGFGRFAPMQSARGGMFSARRRLGVEGEAPVAAPLSEEEVYADGRS